MSLPPRKFLQNKHSEIESETTFNFFITEFNTYILQLFFYNIVQFAYTACMI